MDFAKPTYEQCSAMFAKQIGREVGAGRQCGAVYAFVGYPHLDVLTVEQFAVDLNDIEHTLYDKVESEYSILTDDSQYREKYREKFGFPVCDIPLLMKETLQLGDPPNNELVID